ncbi:olfactory receptor 1052-like [Talpa occidentalis]|uniref:olfactory receptor 1052-like n=1 Tax=Talpa occidentalis TaxID=50954 RepID=UPI00188E694F|nr:olfactory receptor 1052-like [Talpa occidentalis]
MSPGQNLTTVTRFILLGLTDQEEQKQLLFAVFLLIYAVTLVGNLGMIDLIRTSSPLHTPMYFLLSVLSFLDICNSSVFTPRLLISFLIADQSISFEGCVVQMALMILHGTRECLLLAIMAYDRFVAICHPLLYHSIMSKSLCVQLVVVTYAVGVFISAVQTGNVFILPYCGPNVIDHYFCDIPPVLQLACTDTTVANIILLSFSALVTVPTVSIILVSYGYILVTIYRMRSLEAQRKAFSTCASHLTALCLFYGSVFLVYVQPNPESAAAYNKILSVFYTIVIPMLNPLVYSLRNKDVKAALQKKVSTSVATERRLLCNACVLTHHSQEQTRNGDSFRAARLQTPCPMLTCYVCTLDYS